MECNFELDEGEECFDKDDGNDIMDPDVSLCYIEEKLGDVLGHFWKSFEGCSSAEELGKKFDEHGSFLTMNGGSSPVRSHAKLQTNYGTQEFEKSKQTEGPSNKKAHQNAFFRGRAGNASSSVQEVSSTRWAAGNAPLQNDLQLPQVASNSKLNDGSLNKPVVGNGQKSLKIRLKLCQDNRSKKNTTLYSGFGLNNTPPPSLGNNPGETGGLVTPSDEITDDSPTIILQIMTSNSIPGGAIVSPLPDGLLSLLRNEDGGSFKNKNGTSFFNGSQEKIVPLSSKPAVVVGTLSENNVRKPMGKNRSFIGKKNADTLIVEHSSFSKQMFECIISEGEDKEMQSWDLKKHILDSTEANLKKVGRDGAVDKLLSSDLVKLHSLESISGSDMSSKPYPQCPVGKFQSNNTSDFSKVVTIIPRKHSRSYDSMSLPHGKLKYISKDEASRKNLPCKQGDVIMEFEKEKPLSVGRTKFKCSETSERAAASSKEILIPDLVATTNGTDNDVVGHHISTKNCALNESMLENDAWAHSSERRSAKQAKYCSLSSSRRKGVVPFGNLKGIISDQKVDDQASAVSLKDVSLTVSPITADALASEAATPSTPMDKWVQCDVCEKWRLLPYTTMPELPDKWMCSMLDWLPQMNRCDISEDDTTQAVRKSDGTHGLIQISGTSKDIPRISVKRRSLNDMGHVPAKLNALNNTSFRQDEQHKMKGSKRIKLKDAYSGERRQDSNLDLQIASQNVHGSLQMASGSMKKQNEFADFVCDTKERVIVSMKKNVRINQNSSGDGLLDVTMSDKKNSSMRKRNLSDLQEHQNESDVEEESSESGSQRKKSRFFKHEKLFYGGEFPNRKNRTDFAGSSAGVMLVDKAHQLKSEKSKSSFQQSRDTLKKDLVSRSVVTTANSSSSKISGFHKTKVNIEEVKGSPMESVSSSPMRTSYHENLASAFGAIEASDAAANGNVPATTNSRCSDGEGARDLISSGLVKREKRDSDFNTRSHKLSVVEFTGRNTELSVDGKSKDSDIGKSNMLSNGAETIKQKVRLRKQNAFGHCQNDGRANKELLVNPSFLHEIGEEHASQTEDNSKSLAGKKVEACKQPDDREYMNGKKGNIIEISKALHNKSEKYCGRDSLGQKSRGSRMENAGDHHQPVTKLAAQCCTNGNASHLQNHIKDSGGEGIHAEAADSKHKSVPELEVQNKQDSQYYFAAEVPSQRVSFKEFPVKASGNRDVLKVTHAPGNAVRRSVTRPRMTDVHLVGPELSAQKPRPYLFEPCKQLRELADSLKRSGFSFESNEACFKCALEFLRGASLSETRTGEGSKHRDISPMQFQAYSIVIEICKNCAQEYEKCKEMAAASLAYKCMEVAYMRVVYCKNSLSSCARSELQATLMPSQGESPSSSASDVDNLNHQAPVDKGTVSNVSGTHVVAQKQPSIVCLLDFTQNVSSAMEASLRSRKAFEAAKLSLAEAENKECMTFVQKAIDFSFQDVEELIRLVQQALEAISRPDLGVGH